MTEQFFRQMKFHKIEPIFTSDYFLNNLFVMRVIGGVVYFQGHEIEQVDKPKIPRIAWSQFVPFTEFINVQGSNDELVVNISKVPSRRPPKRVPIRRSKVRRKRGKRKLT